MIMPAELELSTSNQGAEIARKFFEFLSDLDVPAWGALWHDEAVITIPYPPTGFANSIVGKDEIVTGFEGLMAIYESFTATIDAVYPAADSDAVVVEYRNHATLAGGVVYSNDNIAVFRFRDGLIAEYHNYFDPRRFQVVVDTIPSA